MTDGDGSKPMNHHPEKPAVHPGTIRVPRFGPRGPVQRPAHCFSLFKNWFASLAKKEGNPRLYGKLYGR